MTEDVLDYALEEVRANLGICTPGRSPTGLGGFVSDIPLQCRDAMGIFLARSVKKGECIMIDGTVTGASIAGDSPAFSNCFGNPSGTAQACAILLSHPPLPRIPGCCHAYLSYDSVICRRDFCSLQNPAAGLQGNSTAMCPQSMLLFLGARGQPAVTKHPVDQPLKARLQAQTH